MEFLKGLKSIAEKIHVMHVVSEKDLGGSSVMGVQKARKVIRQKLDEICETLEDAGIEATPHVYVGEPEQEIEKAARECQASLVVLGSSSKAGWAERWIGSTPRNVAERSMFPTLIIPPEKS